MRRPYSIVLTCSTGTVSPAAASDCSATPAQDVGGPSPVTCTSRGGSIDNRCTIARATSSAAVGRPTWSSTTASARPAAAARRIVRMKLRPSPYTHDVRITVLSPASSRASSPASFVRPYTLSGRG